MQQMPRSMRRWGSMPAMDSPSSSMRPALGARKPQMVFTTVDLPAPLRPMRPLISPAFTSRETSRSTSMSWSYPAVTPSRSSSGSAMGAAPEVRLDHRGVLQHFARGALGDEAPGVHARGAMAEIHHDRHVVAHDEEGVALCVARADERGHGLAHHRVHR